MFCSYSAFLDTLQGQEQNWSTQCLARSVVEIHSQVSCSREGFTSLEQVILLVSLASSASQLLLVMSWHHQWWHFIQCRCFFCTLLLQSPLASLIPQAPAVHSFTIRLSPLQDFCPSAVGGRLHPVCLKNSLLHGSQANPCIRA